MSHLDDIGETYWQHFKFAAQLALVMFLVSVCVLIHAFVPNLFKDTGSRAIKAMYRILEQEGRIE